MLTPAIAQLQLLLLQLPAHVTWAVAILVLTSIFCILWMMDMAGKGDCPGTDTSQLLFMLAALLFLPTCMSCYRLQSVIKKVTFLFASIPHTHSSVMSPNDC